MLVAEETDTLQHCSRLKNGVGRVAMETDRQHLHTDNFLTRVNLTRPRIMNRERVGKKRTSRIPRGKYFGGRKETGK